MHPRPKPDGQLLRDQGGHVHITNIHDTPLCIVTTIVLSVHRGGGGGAYAARVQVQVSDRGKAACGDGGVHNAVDLAVDLAAQEEVLLQIDFRVQPLAGSYLGLLWGQLYSPMAVSA